MLMLLMLLTLSLFCVALMCMSCVGEEGVGGDGSVSTRKTQKSESSKDLNCRVCDSALFCPGAYLDQTEVWIFAKNNFSRQHNPPRWPSELNN